MKNLNTKSLMVLTIFCTSFLAMPMAVLGQEKDYNDGFIFNQFDEGIFDAFRGGFGDIFGNHLGYGGKILGSLFETLFLQGLSLTKYEMLENVFVLSANRSHIIPGGVYRFEDENDTQDIYFAPDEYNALIPGITGMALDSVGHAYCVVQKYGEFNYDIEVGAAVTLVIWDNDGSFIRAVNRLLDFFKLLMTMQLEGRPINQDIIREGISLLTWFLIHINDIFTGDELFILNPITWQRLVITPGPGFEINKTWYITGNDMMVDPGDQSLKDDVPMGQNVTDAWNLMSQDKKDNYMQWLLTPTSGQVAQAIWTQFSFDLIQLWVKNFEIHIDVAAILNAFQGGGGSPELLIANAFEGCNIDFYLFTHHLAGAFLYNDTDDSKGITTYYTPNTVDGTYGNIPRSTELTHRLILGRVYGGFKFDKPKINPSNRSISWGINILNANISAVPLGVDLHSYVNAPQENIGRIHFGFTFEPRVDAVLGAAHGLVKLNQFFDPWNDPESYGTNANIPDLDLAILYVSTVLHFQLAIAVKGQIPETPPELLNREHYSNTTHKLMIGDYIGRSAQGELEFVDIAGPEYEYGSDSSRATAPASTSIIPKLVWEMEHERHDTLVMSGGQEVTTFSSDISIQTELSVLLYAVCYPRFNGTGCGIWHDPTFSVYMIFESEGFWALIVL
ncbi:MAG: hypothetical protein ACFFCL_12815, partial [Promethearchaeota archaeon]